MANRLPANFIAVIRKDLRRGYGIRETARRRGVNKRTVSDLYRSEGVTYYCLCGAEITHQGWCDFRFARSQKRQQFMTKWHRDTDDQNPLCECGCGNEVSRPENRFVLGHSKRTKLTLDHIHAAIVLQRNGFSQAKIGRLFGVSQGWICQATVDAGTNISKARKAISPMARIPVGAKELEHWRKQRETRKDIAKGRKLLRMVRKVVAQKRGDCGEDEVGLA